MQRVPQAGLVTYEEWLETIKRVSGMLDDPLWAAWFRVGELLAEREVGTRLDVLDDGLAQFEVESDQGLQDLVALSLVEGAVAVKDDAGSRTAAVAGTAVASVYLARQLHRWMRNAVLDGQDPVEALGGLERSKVATDAAHTVASVGAAEAARHHEMTGTVAARAGSCPLCVPRIGRRVKPDDRKPPWHSGCDCATLWESMDDGGDGG